MISTLLIAVFFFTFHQAVLVDDTKKAQCKPGVSKLSGHYYVVALYSMFAKGTHEEYDKNAVRFHLKLRYFMARQYYRNQKLLIGFQAYDVCNDTSLVVKTLTNVFLNQRFKPKQHTMTSCTKGSGIYTKCSTCECAPYSSNVLAVVTYLPADMTRLVADIMSMEDIPLFSYTNKDLNQLRHSEEINKRFYSSYDLINKEIKNILNHIEKHNIRNIALVNIGQTLTGLSEYHQLQLWKMISTKFDLCIESKTLSSQNASEMYNYIQYLRNNKNLKLILLWSDMTDRRLFIEQTQNITDKLWYWYTEYSFDNNIDYHLDLASLKTHIFVLHPIYSYLHLNTRFKYEVMKSNMFSIDYEWILNDPWISRYLNEYSLNKSDPEVFSVFDTVQSLDEYYVEAILTPMWWSQPWKRLKTYSLERMWGALDYFSNTRVYKHMGDGLISRSWTDVENMFASIKNVNSCEIISCTKGMEPFKGFHAGNSSNSFQYSWICVNCKNGFYKESDDNSSCKRCLVDFKSTKNRLACYDPYKDHYLTTENHLVKISLGLAVNGVVLTLIFLYAFIRYRHTPIIRSSSYDSSMLHLVTHILMFVSSHIEFLQKPSALNCVLELVVGGALMTIIIAITITKTQKLLYAFNSKIILSRTSIILTKSVEWFILLILLMLHFLICGVMFSKQFPTVESKKSRTYFPHDSTRVNKFTRELSCSNLIPKLAILIYILVLSCFCCVQAFRARKLPKHFNETRRIICAMLITILIVFCTFAIYFTQKVRNNTELKAILLVAITIVTLNHLLCMYLHKVLVVLFRPEKNTKEVFQTTMMQNAEKAATRELKQIRYSLGGEDNRMRTQTVEFDFSPDSSVTTTPLPSPIITPAVSPNHYRNLPLNTSSQNVFESISANTLRSLKTSLPIININLEGLRDESKFEFRQRKEILFDMDSILDPNYLQVPPRSRSATNFPISFLGTETFVHQRKRSNNLHVAYIHTPTRRHSSSI